MHKILNNDLIGEKRAIYFYMVLLIGIAVIIYYFAAKDLEAKIALEGWGPHDYVAHKLHPENFIRDWPSGILNDDLSIGPLIYLFFAKYFNIYPTSVMYPYLFLQIVLFLFSLAYLSYSLFSNKDIAVIIFIVLLLSNAAGINLARFGVGVGSVVSTPKYWAFASSFRFMGIAFFLNNKYRWSMICIAAATYFHLTMGLFAFIFVASFIIVNPSILRVTEYRQGLIIYLSAVLPLGIEVLRRTSATIQTGMIPPDLWILSTRIFSVHSYPVTMKLFSANARYEFIPIMILALMFFISLSLYDCNNDKFRKLIAGIISSVILTIVGVVFTDVLPLPLIVKLQPQRSSEYITIFGSAFIIYYLMKRVSYGNTGSIILSLYAFFVFLLFLPGIVILPFLTLAYAEVRLGLIGPFRLERGSSKNWLIFCYFGTVCISIFLMLFDMNIISIEFFKKHLWTPLVYLNPFSGFNFTLYGGVAKYKKSALICIVLTMVFTVLIKIMNAQKLPSIYRSMSRLSVLALLLSVIFYSYWSNYRSWSENDRSIAISYLDVQKWANMNTDRSALFLRDPKFAYGWRDFSERSSFGSTREWGFTSVLYFSDIKIYQAGLERILEFGVDVTKVKDDDFKKTNNYYGYLIENEVHEQYYKMTDLQIKSLMKRYRIDYVVMDKRYQARKYLGLNLSYENNHFIVYSLSDVNNKKSAEASPYKKIYHVDFREADRKRNSI